MKINGLELPGIDAAPFLQPQFAGMLTFSDSIDEILAGFASYVPPPSKWSPATSPAARP